MLEKKLLDKQEKQNSNANIDNINFSSNDKKKYIMIMNYIKRKKKDELKDELDKNKKKIMKEKERKWRPVNGSLKRNDNLLYRKEIFINNIKNKDKIRERASKFNQKRYIYQKIKNKFEYEKKNKINKKNNVDMVALNKEIAKIRENINKYKQKKYFYQKAENNLINKKNKLKYTNFSNLRIKEIKPKINFSNFQSNYIHVGIRNIPVNKNLDFKLKNIRPSLYIKKLEKRMVLNSNKRYVKHKNKAKVVDKKVGNNIDMKGLGY